MNKLFKNKYFRIMAGLFYLHYLFASKPQDGEVCQAVITLGAILVWLFWMAVSTAISLGVAYLMAPKPPKPRHAVPAGLEQFDVPTAEEGRPVQVLFGSRYVTGPNIVWYGDLKCEPVIERL